MKDTTIITVIIVLKHMLAPYYPYQSEAVLRSLFVMM